MRGTERSNRSHGFTIIELLVVITIIGMLMALVLPAIGMAQVAARRVQCISKQRAIAQAVVAYATTKDGKMPASRPYSLGGGGWSSWVVPILPYLEKQAVYDSLDVNKAYGFEEFYCPADPPESSSGNPLSFVANCGLGQSNGTPGASLENRANGAWSVGGSKPTVCTIDYISQHDGTASTLLCTENVDATDWLASSPQKYQVGVTWSDLSAFPQGASINRKIGEVTGEAAGRPSSRHPGGVIMAYCDVTVKFRTERIEYQTFARMLTSYGKESAAGWQAIPWTADDLDP